KDTPKDYKQYLLTPEQEEALKRRFNKVDDPLSFVIVTAKWMTGFNAPIEGVLYLDKPAKGANLFQTITRPNRPWKNPITGQRKAYGRVVDYIGLAKAIGEAIRGPKAKGDQERELNVTDASQLAGKFVQDLTRLMALFDGVDTSDSSFEALAEAHERIKAMNGDGRPLIIPAPDDALCALIVTAEQHRERVLSPAWRRVILEELIELLDGEFDVLFNPNGPASVRLA